MPTPSWRRRRPSSTRRAGAGSRWPGRSSSTNCDGRSSPASRSASATPIARAPRRRGVVHPLGLVEKGSTWYLVGDTDNGLRTFRVNRVRSVELTGAKAERPPDFDLAAVWQEVVDTVERKRARLQAVVRVDRRGYLGLREQFGPTTRIVADPAADGNNDRIDVEVGAGSAWIIAQHLAGWADYVEVISPPEVRDRLAEIGRLLVAHYV